jgi:hypothetical protein
VTYKRALLACVRHCEGALAAAAAAAALLARQRPRSGRDLVLALATTPAGSLALAERAELGRVALALGGGGAVARAGTAAQAPALALVAATRRAGARLTLRLDADGDEVAADGPAPLPQAERLLRLVLALRGRARAEVADPEAQACLDDAARVAAGGGLAGVWRAALAAGPIRVAAWRQLGLPEAWLARLRGDALLLRGLAADGGGAELALALAADADAEGWITAAAAALGSLGGALRAREAWPRQRARRDGPIPAQLLDAVRASWPASLPPGAALFGLDDGPPRGWAARSEAAPCYGLPAAWLADAEALAALLRHLLERA